MTRERDPIDEYLNEVCWAMGGTLPEQQAARDELRAHIREESRDLELQGMTAPEALKRALSDLGSAVGVGRALRSSRGTAAVRRPLLQPEGAVIVGRRHDRSLPPTPVVLALVALFAAGVAVALSFAWPA